MELALQNALKRHLHEGKITFASVILIACDAVEQFAAASKDAMGGSAKLSACLGVLPFVCDRAVEHGYCTKAQADKAQAGLEKLGKGVVHVIECYCAISNNPEFLAIKQEIEAGCGGCLKK